MTKNKLPHSLIVRAPGLLPLLHTFSEISSLMNIPNRTLRDWLAYKGVPYIRDGGGHIWINGIEFASWVEKSRKPKGRDMSGLQTDQMYCLRCKQSVHPMDPVRHPFMGKVNLIKGNCPHWGGTVVRGSRQLK